ncbi:hypothetical protein RvY_09557 [Ramazzottius varieornatus]|uniref:Anaphase-promoting complex subunit 4 WD40 domain-containing protein n=1 Tax=Ramazzottius varieornatus TaxID=947166 RepID=A0A1D1VC60_RAMVA|nr:hypothetical protein RvY_09557 [Ramazzottius varieornatus]
MDLVCKLEPDVNVADIECTKVDWNCDGSLIAVAGLDGRLIIWKNSAPATRNGQLPGVTQQALIVPNKKMIIQNQETLLKSDWTNREISTIGITVMHTFPEGSQQTCLVGTDTGAIGSCSLQQFKDIGSPVDAVVLLSHNLGHKSHNGPVTSLSRSPFLDACFLTTSTDTKIRLYRMLKVH